MPAPGLEARRSDPGARLVAIKYLLDTDHASILQRPGGADYAMLVARLNLHAADGVGVSVASIS